MDWRRRSSTIDNDNPRQIRNEVKDFLSCGHLLLSDEEILEFLAFGGEKSEGGENKDGSNVASRRIVAPWKGRIDSCDERLLLRCAFRQRTAEVRALTADLRDGLGGTRIDEDGRLIRVLEPPQENPPLPVRGMGNNEDNNINNNNIADGNNNMNPQLMLPGNNNHINNPLDPQQENPEFRFLEQQRRETEATISLAVKELRSQNKRHIPVGEEEEVDFEVVLLDSRGRPVPATHDTREFFGVARNNNVNNNFFPIYRSLRRLFVVFLIVPAAMVCTLLQILPLYSMMAAKESFEYRFDPLLHEVLEVREWRDHVRECPGGLANRGNHHDHHPYDNSIAIMWRWLLNRIRKSDVDENPVIDCSKGVLHIPSKRVISLDCFESLTKMPKTGKIPKLEKELKEYAFGVDVSWFMPCSGHPTVYFDEQQCNPQEMIDKEKQCTSAAPTLDNDSHSEQSRSDHSISNSIRRRSFDKCFRGIHNDLIEDREIKAAMILGNALIDHGRDHFDVHYEVSLLSMMVPSIVQKVRRLLDTKYLHQLQNPEIAPKNGVEKDEQEESKDNDARIGQRHIEPVAFRVLTTGPMDGHDVKLKHKGEGMSMYLTDSSALNEVNYLDWVLQSRQHNDRVRYESYYLPWPFRREPKRETCDLKFDLEADSRFCIQSTIDLTSGAGEDYQGGTSLFVDNHPSNFGNPKRRIARGVSVDGSRGQIVVSTGGFENLKCRFPTRSGFRTVLQIWWDCEDK
mmetsp:Transcript_2308/g.4955  ORF Transcript_2308/g.4955 Transcript_2308/m.4955 type:complete len:740 (-) Transcript_2308:154-2373(-)|eukprot:CAMPEP_0168311136 /NCGR_PEP_ID=MMETSP0142_2-20121227/67209_1 /TAXON_ID=44445 /ORGANISM="Pseudo-nitzschia australis, Strain 10249 10 AB" /LENGTH=739 /DNA_ID=CAMNT_0008264025 /DNA_START=66 /DNA_END=2285 /DNA_ORIENTATION=-